MPMNREEVMAPSYLVGKRIERESNGVEGNIPRVKTTPSYPAKIFFPDRF